MTYVAEDIVPLVLFVMVGITYCVKYYFAWRTRQEVQDTIRSALERGQPLTPDILDRLGQPGRPRNADLRRGIICIALGLGLAGFGVILADTDALRPLIATGLVPFLIGLAYVGLWRLDSSRN